MITSTIFALSMSIGTVFLATSAMMKGIEVMSGKEQTITTITFKEWSEDK